MTTTQNTGHTTSRIAAQEGRLRELLVGDERAAELRREAVFLPSLDLTQRQVWDIELLLNGAFSPLEGFLGVEDYDAVCRTMRLRDGSLWPIPITLDISRLLAESLAQGNRLALRHPEGMVLAIMTVTDVWEPDKLAEARLVFDTTDEHHPGIFALLRQTHPVYLGGKLEAIELPPHHTFPHLRHTPAQLRARFAESGWEKVIAFQTRNPLHRAHVELTRQAMDEVGGRLLIHPVVGRTSPGDIDYYVRVRCYQAALLHYPQGSALLSLLPLAMRMAGPREAVWHALIRRNYGCTHFIVGRDHSGPKNSHNGNGFYAPYAAQELVLAHQEEIGIQIVPFEEMVYSKRERSYIYRSSMHDEADVLTLSGTELRRRLREGREVPTWFSYPEVISELRRSYPPRDQQGFTVFFTGLPSSGKSTLAQTLMVKLMEIGSRPVTLLDGDIVRKNLSSELGFSKEHRDLNIKRIGFVASEITKNRGVAICAPIAPYRALRREVREMIEQHGGFIEVYISTPLEVCEARDRKGFYAKARAGLIQDFTGIDDPYEEPERVEVTVDTASLSPEQGVEQVMRHLVADGYLGPT